MARLVSFPPGPGRTFTRGPQEQLNVQAGARALRSILGSFGESRKRQHEQALLSQLLSGQRPVGTRPETREQIIARSLAEHQAAGAPEDVLAQVRGGRVAMPPKQGVLQRLAAAFRPTGPFTGPQTQLEKLLGATQLKAGLEQVKAGAKAPAEIQTRVTAMDKEIRSALKARSSLTLRNPPLNIRTEDLASFKRQKINAITSANTQINILAEQRDRLAGQIGLPPIQLGPDRPLPRAEGRIVPETRPGSGIGRTPARPPGVRIPGRPGLVAPTTPRVPTTEELMQLFGISREIAQAMLGAGAGQ